MSSDKHIRSCGHHYKHDGRHFHHSLKFPSTAAGGKPLPHPHGFICFVFLVLPFPECHIKGIIEYVAFWVWLLSLSIMNLRFICVVVVRFGICSFSLMNSMLLNGCATFSFSIHQNFFFFFSSPQLFWVKPLKTFVCVCVNVKFLFVLDKYQEWGILLILLKIWCS